MLKRIGLFLMVNFLVVVTISIVLNVLQIGPYLTGAGINYSSLMIFCLIWGMGGAFISLLLSRFMAKKMMGVRILEPNKTREQYETKLVSRVYTLARKAGLSTMPEVGIYDSAEINAFATGPSKNRSLVAVSTGLLHSLNDEEVEGVLAHEVAHIANGDMVTMTLLQGVVNAFVMFFARLAAQVVTGALNRNSDSRSNSGFLYYGLVWVFEIALMILGSLLVFWFSRYREYRADAGGAALSSKQAMVNALKAIGRKAHIKDEESPESLAAFQINGHSKLAVLFSTHPPLSERIKALEQS
jgi:heat shock protein HtpX